MLQPLNELQVKELAFTGVPVIVHWAFKSNENTKTATNNSKNGFMIYLFLSRPSTE